MDMALDELIQRLFDLQDLSSDGFLGEDELVQLNKKVIMLHKGRDVNKEEIRARYQELFRTRLSASGEPVPLSTFRKYILELLDSLDNDKTAQLFILEQWIVEADLGRRCFQDPSMQSLSDVPYLLVMSRMTAGRRAHKADESPAAPAPCSCTWRRDCSWRRELTGHSSIDEETVESVDVTGLDAVDVISGNSLRRSRLQRTRIVPRVPPPTLVLDQGSSSLSIGGGTHETVSVWGHSLSDDSLDDLPEVEFVHSAYSAL